MSDVTWYYAKGGTQHGPVTDAELRHLAASGGIGPEDHVRRDGESAWVTAAEIPGLFPVTPAAGVAPDPVAELSSLGNFVVGFAFLVPPLALVAHEQVFLSCVGWDTAGPENTSGRFICVMVFLVLVAGYGAKGVVHLAAHVGRPLPVRYARVGLYAALAASVVLAGRLVFVSHRTFVLHREIHFGYAMHAVRSQAKGDHRQAVEHCDTALRYAHSADVFRLRAESYLALGEPDKAIADLDQVVRIAPAEPRGYGLRAEAYAKKGDRESAERDRAAERTASRQ